MYFKRNRYVSSNGKSTKMAIDIFPYLEKYQRNSVFPDEPCGDGCSFVPTETKAG